MIKTINIIEVNPNKFSDEPNVLTSTLTNGVYLALKNKDTDQAQLLFTKLKKLYQTNQDSRSKDLSLKIKSSLWSIELLLVKLTCDFKQFGKGSLTQPFYITNLTYVFSNKSHKLIFKVLC